MTGIQRGQWLLSHPQLYFYLFEDHDWKRRKGISGKNLYSNFGENFVPKSIRSYFGPDLREHKYHISTIAVKAYFSDYFFSFPEHYAKSLGEFLQILNSGS